MTQGSELSAVILCDACHVDLMLILLISKCKLNNVAHFLGRSKFVSTALHRNVNHLSAYVRIFISTWTLYEVIKFLCVQYVKSTNYPLELKLDIK